LTGLYQLIRCYELGNWDEVERLARQCGIPPSSIGEAYIDATLQAEQIVHSVNQAAGS